MQKNITTNDIKRIKTLIEVQLEYLKDLEAAVKEERARYSCHENSGFFRSSLEVYKQITKLKYDK